MDVLCHLADFNERLSVLREARRVLRPQGVLVAAALSRWATALVHAAAGQLADPTSHQRLLVSMRDGHLPGAGSDDRDLYLHDPQQLSMELHAAGFDNVEVIGVEGPVAPWARQVASLDRHALELARATDTALAGASVHILATAEPALHRLMARIAS